MRENSWVCNAMLFSKSIIFAWMGIECDDKIHGKWDLQVCWKYSSHTNTDQGV